MEDNHLNPLSWLLKGLVVCTVGLLVLLGVKIARKLTEKGDENDGSNETL